MKKESIPIDFPEKNFKIVSVADKIPHIDNMDNIYNIFHEEIEIKLFFKNGATLLVGDDTVVAEEGDIVVINPYKFHLTINADQKESKYHLIMISLDFFAEENLIDLRRLFINEGITINPLIKQNPRLCSIIRDIVYELNNKKNMYQSAVKGLVLEMFSLMLRDYKSKEENDLLMKKNMFHYDVISPALIKIRENYAKSFSVEELADICNVSKYHFCRIFKKVTSVSPLQYQIEYRIRVADVFLRHTNKSIAEIAGLCGFNDAFYFSRCYKKHTGTSPQKIRATLSI